MSACPPSAWGEKEGTVTNSDRVISRQRRFLPAPGEARPDWWALAEVARRLGHGAAFAWRRPADIFREHARLSGTANAGRRLFDISALADLSDTGYADAAADPRWPCPADAAPTLRLFGEGGFPAGRARLVPTAYPPARPLAPTPPGRWC